MRLPHPSTSGVALRSGWGEMEDSPHPERSREAAQSKDRVRDAEADEGFLGLFRAHVGGTPERLFARFDGAPISFAALDRMSDALASRLRQMCIARGERVAVMLRNGPAALAVAYALGKAGTPWLPVNVQQRGEGLRYILEHSAPSLVIAETDLVPTIAGCGAPAIPLLVQGG